MSGIKNSKKNDAGNLLPQRRPRLGKYIALAVLLHVVFGIVYLYVTQREAKKQSEVKAPPVKVVPLSPQNKALRRTQDESPSVPSFRSASRPMSSLKLMFLPNGGNAISPSERLDSPPMDKFIYLKKPNLTPVFARREDYSNKEIDREMKAWPDKQMAHQDMHVAPPSESHFAAPSSEKPGHLTEPLPISGWKKSAGLQQPFQSPVKPKPDSATIEPVRSPATQSKVYLPEKKQSLPIRRQKLPVQLEQMLPSRHRMTQTNERKAETQLLARRPLNPVTFKSMSLQQRNLSLPPRIHTAVAGKPVLKNTGVQMLNPSPAGPDSTDSPTAQKRMNPSDVQMLVLQAEIDPVAPQQHRPVSQPKNRLGYADDILQPIMVFKQSNGSQRDWIRKKKQSVAQTRMNPADVQMLALQAEIRPVTPAPHRPVSRPQTRLVYADDILQPVIFSKTSNESQRDWKDEKKPPKTVSQLVPKELTADLRNRNSARWLQPVKMLAASQAENLSRQTAKGAIRIETVKKTTYLRPKTVWQEKPEISTHIVNYAPLQPELPPLIEDHLADVVKRLIQPALQRYSASKVRILAKNLTYRDLGLESEGTKFLSGLLKSEIEKQDGMELLTPADVSRNPQVVIEGEMWDDSHEINLHLWSLDHHSGHRMHIEDLSFHRQMLPDSVKIQPPPGKNLSLIQRMVELMKQNFPRGGDFQLGVWPDKGVDAVYQEGENLIVFILPEKNAYLHIDYYQIDGKVVHLLSSQDQNNYVKAGVPYIIGDPKGGGNKFEISYPFGEELLVVVASQNPLGTITHGPVEPAEAYIKRLAKSLKLQREAALMAGSHYIILTKKQDTKK
jgi:Domain of unknown function (DUF4384)